MVKPNRQSVPARGFRLGKLALSLTGSYLGYQVQNLFLDENQKQQRRRAFNQRSAQRVTREMAELKGPVMKLGQILSMQTQALSPEAIAELSNLQMQAPGMHPTLARAQFKASVGKYPEEVFREFSPEPFAAASLGQVHEAITRAGEKVAVKIQYPGIAKAIENDFKLLRSATLPGRISGHTPAWMVDEVQRGFSEETDYLNEARNVEFFRKALASFEYLKIPSVNHQWTTGKVLTTSLLKGQTVGPFLKQNPSQAILDKIGSHLFELYHYQIQCVGRLHADHQPGNYLFEKDGSIGLVDFGCVKHLTIDFADLSHCCVHRTWKKGPSQAAHVCRLIWGPKVDLKRANRMLGAMEELVDLLFPEEPDRRVVDFGRPDLPKTLIGCYARAVKHRLTNAEFVFVSRTELGLCSLLHQLGARVNTREMWERVHARVSRAH